MLSKCHISDCGRGSGSYEAPDHHDPLPLNCGKGWGIGVLLCPVVFGGVQMWPYPCRPRRPTIVSPLLKPRPSEGFGPAEPRWAPPWSLQSRLAPNSGNTDNGVEGASAAYTTVSNAAPLIMTNADQTTAGS